jgi:hypothetical protein
MVSFGLALGLLEFYKARSERWEVNIFSLY